MSQSSLISIICTFGIKLSVKKALHFLCIYLIFHHQLRGANATTHTDRSIFNVVVLKATA